MALHSVASVAGASPSPAAEAVKPKFAEALKGAGAGGPSTARPLPEVAPRPVVEPARGPSRSARAASAGTTHAPGGCSQAQARAQVEASAAARAPQAVQVVDHVARAQRQLDSVLRMAESGKSFTQAELLAFQAHVYRASQELDLAGKVVEKATSGVKQILQTQV